MLRLCAYYRDCSSGCLGCCSLQRVPVGLPEAVGRAAGLICMLDLLSACS